jgi:hypothetical protein
MRALATAQQAGEHPITWSAPSTARSWLLGRLAGLFSAKRPTTAAVHPPHEPLDLTTRVDQSLVAGEERVALGA